MAASSSEHRVYELDGIEVRLSNPDKVYFPQAGITKGQLADFYVEIAPAILNHLYDRPTMLKRFAGGIEQAPIYQKRVPKTRPDWLQTVELKFPSGRTAEELVPNSAAHLVWATSLGNVDWNPHPVRRTDLDHPDELRIDLDPMEGAGWDTVRRVALHVRDVLEEHGLRGYPKTSGSTGMHIYVRIRPEHDFGTVRRAALAVAREVARRDPERATARWFRKDRPPASVFVDFGQNAKDHTVAAAYSVRPVPDARVSTPLSWDEVPACDPAEHTIATVPGRLRAVGDPSEDIDDHPGDLSALLALADRDEAGELAGDDPWPKYQPRTERDAQRQMERWAKLAEQGGRPPSQQGRGRGGGRGQGRSRS